MNKLVLGCLCLLGLLLAFGCAPAGPYVRFAKATEAQLASAGNEDVIWFDFQPGDEVPLNVLMLGVAEAGGKGMVLVAKKRFFIVVRRGAAPALSFDGKNIVAEGSETFLAFGRENGENELNIVTYVGAKEDMPAELRDKTR